MLEALEVGHDTRASGWYGRVTRGNIAVPGREKGESLSANARRKRICLSLIADGVSEVCNQLGL